MNCFGRTPSNKSRLRLKGFHRRNIVVRIIEFITNHKPAKQKSYQGSGSGGRGNHVCSFRYSLETIKKYFSYRFGWEKIRTYQTFNKSQLIGKVLLIENRRYRIISKY